MREEADQFQYELRLHGLDLEIHHRVREAQGDILESPRCKEPLRVQMIAIGLQIPPW
jgi:hypothetical protein